MDNFIERYFETIEMKLEEFNKKITMLQDLAINTKIKLDLLAKNIVEKDYLSNLTEIADKDIRLFLEHRPNDCHILDRCTVMIEKSTLKILRTFLDKGAEAADELIDSYIKFSTKPKVISACPDIKCLDQALNLFKNLKKLISSLKKIESRKFEELYKEGDFLDKLERFEGESYLISPLSNEKRIKILKILSRGSLYYNQLEDNIGIKGGPFHFHLKKLLDAYFIEQIEEKGPYSITDKGIRALKFLFDLKEDLSVMQ
ncbi:MAG: winged helix-turn-helix domain-containing protein [Promethearchaeota archaeon]